MADLPSDIYAFELDMLKAVAIVIIAAALVIMSVVGGGKG